MGNVISQSEHYLDDDAHLLTPVCMITRLGFIKHSCGDEDQTPSGNAVKNSPLFRTEQKSVPWHHFS